MSDPLGRMLIGGTLGFLLRRDSQAEKQRQREERDEQRHIERRLRQLRDERHALLMQRVYATVQSTLSTIPCGQFDLPSLVGPAAINRIAAEVTKLVSRELRTP